MSGSDQHRKHRLDADTISDSFKTLKKTMSRELPFNFEQWTVDQTCQYLQQEGLGEWKDKFEEQKITGAELRNLTISDLEKMGIELPGDCLKILHNIRKLWEIPQQVKVFNDPIHGHVELHPFLIKIIDTPQFQRLRNIKQLGGAYFVYPGASHNRFEHSIGVAHFAGELVKALSTRQPELQITTRDILCVQIAGLCHDLGHGPFSHLFDKLFIPKAQPTKTWKHENASIAMFDYLVKRNNLKREKQQWPRTGRDGTRVEDGTRAEAEAEDGTRAEDEARAKDEDMDFIKEMIAGPQKTNEAQSWPYKGRPEDKSFLYEIVANKRNGVDVDKFDYFARDCHHLGIQNNFDHRRFMMFARVCEVDGRKQICTRDKEEDNMYEMFHTRMCLHRRAYQHKVNTIIETMITEAFLKADKHIQIKGSEGKMFTLSTAIDDMEAYTKLTGHGPFSHLFDKIFIPKAQPTKTWKHENASIAMFDYLVKRNNLKREKQQAGAEDGTRAEAEAEDGTRAEDEARAKDEDMDFIKEMIAGPQKTNEAQSWPYKGRPEDKSFLYEIVANKRNGVDVDKFDYFARDCHHLGIQNNFDHRRFMMFARVCEVDGRKQICTRDKEEDNMYEMFHTRMCLHRRAYQHKVNTIIETMITEAFLKADKHIQIKGSEGKMFTLSTAIDDMEAYTKLTGHGPFSHLFDKIFIPKAQPTKTWKHENASIAMFDYLVKSNNLKREKQQYGLVLAEDRTRDTRAEDGTRAEAEGRGRTTRAEAEAEAEWPYKGRPEDKSFLYEIVANKRNGVDVDKFDYFARDCHHLGIQNNFDHRRFMMFARVCEVDGRKQICTRDKEEDNMYEMFHTRMCLHRRAYQHKVNTIIETMITEAFLKADKHIQIKGSEGKMFTLSTAIDDMEAYTKLTGLSMAWCWPRTGPGTRTRPGTRTGPGLRPRTGPGPRTGRDGTRVEDGTRAEAEAEDGTRAEDEARAKDEDMDFIKEMIAGPQKTNEAQSWPYKGRPEDKSFLYEIVANKRNGVDVDKFDYFARDCHHLGIQNNFDHRRFMMFARVCEVDGRKQICTRDKEEDNMYEMFHTRMCLHRRAYQHKVNTIIETMITEAFLKADKHIQIKGSEGKMFTLSTAIDDMEAYTKLTGHGPFSHLFDKIFIPKAQPTKTWKHENASIAMFDYLVKSNNLKWDMQQYGLVLAEDRTRDEDATRGEGTGPGLRPRTGPGPRTGRDGTRVEDGTRAEAEAEDGTRAEDEARAKDEDMDFIKEMIAGPQKTNEAQSVSLVWPYKGRPEDKSFLYEIVANKRNGVDVDKFDYFARDCHHLGIQNNFDHRRFMMFARVCEVDGRKQICTRDKEEDNMYEMFHTRMCLHRRAYQHKVNTIIETMITEAFLKADKHIQIKGSEGKMFTLSTAIDDMEAYTKLTDQVFEQILNSSSSELQEAREILSKIVSRNFPKFLGEIEKPTHKCFPFLDWKEQLARALPPRSDSLTPEDFEVQGITIDCGKKDKNPIDYICFYSKYNPEKAFKMKVSKFRPTRFSEHSIRFYCKKTDDSILKADMKSFDTWCESKELSKLSV
ncbi:uncharacterized protein LOC122882805 [Siniperca chuatsi]|uniref:uncharacterized protein LOC122882805 n=1 Tax=Siniperca chuatsi TaxID=119488 RepID=UPI001CE0DD64|nr:uncharacterized protein LOC122882805 [Siniperca chuatsi]